MKMAEGYLLGDDGDVILEGVAHELGHVGGRHGAIGRRGERVVGVEKRVFEVGGVEIGFVGGEDADLMLLELERGHGPAGEIVLNAAVLHGRPVTNSSGGQYGARAGERKQLLEGLHAVENARGGRGDDGGLMLVEDEDVAFVVHGRVECEMVLFEKRFRFRGLGAHQDDFVALSSDVQ